MKKTFLLGVGAQKAGTTWLYQYLRSHPGCAMGQIKEHAVLRAALGQGGPSGRFPAKARALIDTLQAAAELPEGTLLEPDTRAALLALADNVMGEFDPAYYLMTFERLLAAQPTATLTGDITPEYCMLSVDQLRHARRLIEAAGYDLKVVFLMRDPLDRIHSALRMADRNRRDEGRPVHFPAAERFDVQGVAEWVELRTRYEVILANLDAVFDPDQVYLGFYETFFTQASLGGLLEFLGLASHPANFGHMANASPSGAAIAPEKIATVRAYYDATYRACADRFGARFIKQIWPYS